MPNNYKCVNCGEAAEALYTKLNDDSKKPLECSNCKGVLDKYIEYDPVIVMINLVLISTEGLRHILYNTPYKSYWKLLTTMMLLETYGLWKNDSLFNTLVNLHCGFDINSRNISIEVDYSSQSNCWAWKPTHKDSILLDNLTNLDIFSWQKDFGIQLLSLFFGATAFLIILQLLMAISSPNQNRVPLLTVVKAYSLADASRILTLSILIWGSELSPHTKTGHYLVVFAYSIVLFSKVFTVVYECPLYRSVIVLIICIIAKYATCYHAMPLLKELFS